MNKIRPLNRNDNLSNSSMFFNRLSSDVCVYEYLLLCRFISNLTTGYKQKLSLHYECHLGKTGQNVPSETNWSVIVLPSAMLSTVRDRWVPVLFAYFVGLGHRNRLGPKCNSISPRHAAPKCRETIRAAQHFRHVGNSEWLRNVCHSDRSKSILKFDDFVLLKIISFALGFHSTWSWVGILYSPSESVSTSMPPPNIAFSIVFSVFVKVPMVVWNETNG